MDQGSLERQSKSPQSCARTVAKKAYEWKAWDYRIVGTAMRNVCSRRYKYEEAWDQIQSVEKESVIEQMDSRQD